MQGGWASSIALFIYAAAFSFAYRKLTTATGALLLFGAVQLTMLTHGLVGGEHLVPRQWIGLILSFGGLLVLLLPGAASPPLFYGGLMLSSGIAWGVYSIRGKGSTAPPLEATTGNFVRTLPLAFALSLLTVTSSHVTANGALLALGSGAIASAGGYVIWYSVLPRLQRTTAAAVQLAVPVLASLFGVALLAEALTLRLVLLSCAILGGIGLVLLGPKRAS
jgi:drug/metabolite transporter (DMT)-like permease